MKNATHADIRKVFREARAAANDCRIWVDGDAFDPDTGYALVAARDGISVVSQRSSVSTHRSTDMKAYAAVLAAAGFPVATTVRNGRVTAVKVVRS